MLYAIDAPVVEKLTPVVEKLTPVVEKLTPVVEKLMIRGGLGAKKGGR